MGPFGREKPTNFFARSLSPTPGFRLPFELPAVKAYATYHFLA